MFQRVGRSNYITVADCNKGYCQLGMKEQDNRLTAFVCDAALLEFNRARFGLKGRGNSFVRCITKILRPVRSLMM